MEGRSFSMGRRVKAVSARAVSESKANREVQKAEAMRLGWREGGPRAH